MFERLHDQAEQNHARKAQLAAEQAFAQHVPELAVVKEPVQLMNQNIEWANSLNTDLENTGIRDVFAQFETAMGAIHEDSTVTLAVSPFKWISDGIVTSSELERCAEQRMPMLRALAGYCLSLTVNGPLLRSDNRQPNSEGMLIRQDINVIASQATLNGQKTTPRCVILPNYRRLYMPHSRNASGNTRTISGGPTLEDALSRTTALSVERQSEDSISVNYDLNSAQGLTYAVQPSEFFQKRARKKFGRIDALSLYESVGERAYSLPFCYERKISSKDLATGAIAGPLVADGCTLDVSSQLAAHNTRELIAERLEWVVLRYGQDRDYQNI